MGDTSSALLGRILAELDARFRVVEQKLDDLSERQKDVEVAHNAELARLLEKQSRIETQLGRLETIEHALEELAEKQTRLETRVAVSEFRAREGAVGYRQRQIREFRRLLGGSRGESLDAPRFWS